MVGGRKRESRGVTRDCRVVGAVPRVNGGVAVPPLLLLMMIMMMMGVNELKQSFRCASLHSHVHGGGIG